MPLLIGNHVNDTITPKDENNKNVALDGLRKITGSISGARTWCASLLMVFVCLFLASCGGEDRSNVPLVSITITPKIPLLTVGATQQLTATGTYEDQSTRDLTSMVRWSTMDSAVVSVSDGGLATALAEGMTKVAASLDEITGKTTITVTPATLVSIEITPVNPMLIKGKTQAFVATGTYSNKTTKDVSSLVKWVSATASTATIDNQGVATGLALGTTTISASYGGQSAKTTLTVVAAPLVSIVVTPANPSISKGTTQQFVAMGAFADMTMRDISTLVTWSSMDMAIATISAQGLATGVGVGSSTISASLMGQTGTTLLSVTMASLTSVAITPANPSVAKTTTQQLTATGTYSDGSTQNLTAMATWASSDTTVATISNAMGTQGLATGIAIGNTTISASVSGKTAMTVLSVTMAPLNAIAVAPASPSIVKGTTQQFTATGTFADGSTQDITSTAIWASSDTAVAGISNAMGTRGLSSGLGVGTATISASLMGKMGTATLTVTMATLTAIAVTPASPAIFKDISEQFTATGTYSDGSTQNLTTLVTWASSDALVATISNAMGSQGLATAIGAGSASITASLGGKSGSATLTVKSATLMSIAISPMAPSIVTGSTQAFTATGMYSDGSTLDLTGLSSWSSSAVAVATISNAAGTQGLATSVGAGSTTITATFGGTSGSTTLTVMAPVLVSITVSPGAPSITLGSAQQFTATGHYSDGMTQSLTTLVTWSSSVTSVATISNSPGTQGRAVGGGIGTTTITASIAGKTDSATLTVKAPTLVSISVSPSFESVSRGASKQFSAIATFSDGSMQNVTTMVSWSSSSTAVATVSNSAGSQGRATGVGTGTATITASGGGRSGYATLNVF